MKNPFSVLKKKTIKLLSRWSAEDYPGGEARFQLMLLGKDVAIFLILPLFSVILFKMIEGGATTPKRPPIDQKRSGSFRLDTSKSQIINFQSNSLGNQASRFIKKAPGTLVRVKLQNVVATYSNAPVHAQIVDVGLGKAFLGGTLIGDAVPDPNFERINITFRFARDPVHEGIAAGISARALSLDGTLGLEASKKDGFFTRSVYGSANSTSQNLEGKENSVDLKTILFRALSVGFVQEFGSGAQVEKNRSQVLTLSPATEFIAELTDYFPGVAAK